MSMTRSEDLTVTISTDFYIYDGEHHVRVQILDCSSLDGIYADLVPVGLTYRTHMDANCVLINVKSYVTSLANGNQDEPILCLTSIAMCDHNPIKASSVSIGELFKEKPVTTSHVSFIPPGLLSTANTGRIPGGKIVDFLTNIAPYMSFEALSGCHEASATFQKTPKSSIEAHNRKIMKLATVRAGAGSNRERIVANYDNTTDKLEVIARFLDKYQAMNTLVMVAQKEDNDELGQIPSTVTLQMSVIESFRTSQVERHKASITANRGRTEPTPTTNTVIQQHQDVLQEIYDHEIPLVNQSTELHIDMLHYCHMKLCQDLIPESGRFRTKTVRVSNTNFVYHGQMHDIVSCLLLSIQNLRTRLVYHNYDRKPTTNLSSNVARTLSTATTFFSGTYHSVSNQNGQQRTPDRSIEQQRVLATVTYAAAACMGILDTHPYLDGNGRLARIVLNFILYHELQLPFPVPLFATPEQRVAYTKAICKTRQNIALLPVGHVPDELLIQAYENCGALQPMVDLILKCVYISVTKCNIEIVGRLSAQTEEFDYSRTARTVRERALNSDSCPICFESPPNMSTLCCGTSYHLKCLAQWLKTNGKCPNCRFEIPPWVDTTNLSGDMSRIANFFSDIIPSDFHEYQDDTLAYGLMSLLQGGNGESNGMSHQDSEVASNTNDVELSDDDNNNEENDTDDNNTEQNDDDNDTEMNDTVVTNLPPICLFCSNRSALGCSFSLCASCCRGGGRYCSRHWH